MSWTSENWYQDNDINLGFPYSTDPAPKSNMIGTKSFWNINKNINSGFPYPIEPTTKSDLSNAKSMWAFSQKINIGFPYINLLFDSYDWEESVIDRTINDIKNAYKNLKQKKQNHTIEFRFTKAYLNYTDLNRIENNSKYLSKEIGLSIQSKTDWSTKMIPFVSDKERILQNMNAIRTKFLEIYPEAEIIAVPTKLSTYTDFNQLENVQLQIYEAISEGSE